ncbi:Uncharacterized protein DBV15_07255 [Temnothorax longispinosus]|uniref:Uncharacterized protein n=1 Tax=Temnothorax longispinosus TaxID=300112 RepID=A0A4S2JNG8_9HYME|nr:Uncharacterized protein DBV15_07255 [Temnothorax longispinosus]
MLYRGGGEASPKRPVNTTDPRFDDGCIENGWKARGRKWWDGGGGCRANLFKKQNTRFWHSFARQPSDTGHRSADYTAENFLRASTSRQKKHHSDHPAPPPLCIRSARFIAAIYPLALIHI